MVTLKKVEFKRCTPMDEGSIRPETLALDALIAASLERVVEGRPQADSMLFLGNRHASFPALVVQDPVLEPVDKLVWMSIALPARETGENTAFPTYPEIARIANVSSTATIARAIAILRATRWLTLCARLRNTNGRFQGNVYVLHDEPLPLVDVLHLDSGYMQFLRESAGHHHARVRAVAQGVLDTIDEDIEAGLDVCARHHPVQQRLEAAEAVQKEGTRRFFAFSAKALAQLGNQSVVRNPADHQDQNLKAVGKGVQNLNPQNLKAGSGSSSYIYKTTTPTTQKAGSNFESTGQNQVSLVYPQRLSDNHCDVANRYLNNIPVDQRQLILDELEGRIRAEEKGMKPLFDELSYLHTLCKALKNKTFEPKLGIRVLEERQAREKAQRKSRQRSRPQRKADLQGLRDQITAGEGAITEMRKILGVSSKSAPKEPTDPS